MLRFKQTVFIIALSLYIHTLQAQIKIFSGGSISYGSTGAPAYGEKHHFSGDVMISSSSTLGNSAIFMRGNSGYSGATTPDYSWSGDNQTGFFHPASNVIALSIGGSEKMRLNGSGQILNSNATSSASTPDFSWNSDANTGFFRPGSDILGFVTGGSERGRITSSGNLVLGQTSDNGGRLMVNAGNAVAITATVSHSADYGQAAVILANKYLCKTIDVFCSESGTLTETFKLWGAGDAWGKSWTSWSDKNLKENIDSLQNALSKIKQLKGVKYNFKSSFVGAVASAKKEIGLIAQDVELVVPEVVNTDENGIKGIMYQNLIPLLIEAIKEQDKKITQLESDLNSCCTKTNSNNRIINQQGQGSGEQQTGDSESYIKQNKPNPFNKETVIEYNIAEKNAVSSLLIFDMTGKLLKTLRLNNGVGSVTINGSDLRPGMYYYSLIVNDKEIDTKKMILTE